MEENFGGKITLTMDLTAESVKTIWRMDLTAESTKKLGKWILLQICQKN